MIIKRIKKTYYKNRTLAIMILSCLFMSLLFSFAIPSIPPQSDDIRDKLSTSFTSLEILCDVLIEGDTRKLKMITTNEGYETLCYQRGIGSLSIDAIFWKSALENGKVFVFELINTEKEFDLMLAGKQHETLLISSYSSGRLMLIEKITFVKEDDIWKFVLFEDF